MMFHVRHRVSQYFYFFRLHICFCLTNKLTLSVVARNDRCSRRTSPSEICLSNKSIFHSSDEDEPCLQYNEKRCKKLNHKTPLFIQKKNYTIHGGVKPIGVSSHFLHISVNWIDKIMCYSQFNWRLIFKIKDKYKFISYLRINVFF